jgi:predicted RNase H-like nuclease
MVVKKLPYKNLAGVTTCPGGWLVLPARMAGVTVACEEAFVVPRLFDVLDFRPTFDAAAINAPMGLKDFPDGPWRACDVDARQNVGWPRAAAIYGTPSRQTFEEPNSTIAAKSETWMNGADKRRYRWLREAVIGIQPYHARRIVPAHPDVTFTAMNGDEKLKTSPWHEDGRRQRLELIREQLPGVDEVVTRTPPPGAHPKMLLDAAAMLWTARRQAGRAISRFPLDPTWDSEGMRTELVR